MLVNSKLGRYCERCSERFIPDGKRQKICLNCNKLGDKKKEIIPKLILKPDKYLLTYNKLKIEYSKVLHNETLKKYYILSKAYKIGIKIYGIKYSQSRLSKDFDIPDTTIRRILSLRRANKQTWKLIRSGKLSSFKATQILLTKNNNLQDEIVKAIINDNLSTYEIKKYNKIDSLHELKKMRLNNALERGFARKSTAYVSFIHYINQLSKMLDLNKEDLPESYMPNLIIKLKKLNEKINKYILKNE